jgi:hypothetical protein
MAEPRSGAPSPLRRFIQRAQKSTTGAGEQDVDEQCELCSQPIPPQHRHLLELQSLELICVCLPCSILFDRKAASMGQFRLIPDRRLFLESFHMPDHAWASLKIPVDVAFFVDSSLAQRTIAYYPSPLGPTESTLQLSAWQQLRADNPILQEMAQDVEALLVNRTHGARDHYLVPISDCYRLSGLLRSHWQGIGGGDRVWQEVGRFFEELRTDSGQ